MNLVQRRYVCLCVCLVFVWLFDTRSLNAATFLASLFLYVLFVCCLCTESALVHFARGPAVHLFFLRPPFLLLAFRRQRRARPVLPPRNSQLPSMTGRAKGRARGRSRGGVQPEARRPGEPQPTPPSGAEQQYVGRGRGRAVTSAPPPAQQQPPPKPPVQQMAEMGINGSAQPQPKPHQPTAQQPTAQQPPQRGGRGVFPPDPHTRPEHITDKRGSSGTHIDVTSNFVVLRNRPDCAIFQYNVSYSPQVDSRKRRLGMLYEQETLVGKVRAFDGMILYLPHRLPQDVTTVLTKTDEGQTDVTITITLTNEVHTNSPVCLQLFNILFRRYMCVVCDCSSSLCSSGCSCSVTTWTAFCCRILSRLEMKQIGRHYYSPQLPVKVPQHK